MIRLARPRLGFSELAGVRRVFASRILVQGEEVERFEREIASYVGVKHAIATTSGTTALHLAMLCLDIGPGDEVIAPAFTFPATTNVIEHAGGSTRLVDIDARSLCIAPELIEGSICEKTKAVIVVHEFGQSADLDPILRQARARGLRVIEDAACALGASYRGKMVGSLGEIGCFSFHPRKAITTGEGGALVTDSDAIAERARRLRNHGMGASKDGTILFVDAGYNYRMTNIQGAIGCAQMKRLTRLIARRIELAAFYDELFKDSDLIEAPTTMGYGKHIFQTYHVYLPQNVDRTKLIAALKKKGVETNYGAYGVHEQPYYQKKYGYSPGQFKNASRAYHHGLALPLHDGLTPRDIRYAAASLVSAIRENSL